MVSSALQIDKRHPLIFTFKNTSFFLVKTDSNTNLSIGHYGFNSKSLITGVFDLIEFARIKGKSSITIEVSSYCHIAKPRDRLFIKALSCMNPRLTTMRAECLIVKNEPSNAARPAERKTWSTTKNLKIFHDFQNARVKRHLAKARKDSTTNLFFSYGDLNLTKSHVQLSQLWADSKGISISQQLRFRENLKSSYEGYWIQIDLYRFEELISYGAFFCGVNGIGKKVAYYDFLHSNQDKVTSFDNAFLMCSLIEEAFCEGCEYVDLGSQIFSFEKPGGLLLWKEQFSNLTTRSIHLVWNRSTVLSMMRKVKNFALVFRSLSRNYQIRRGPKK